MTTPTQTETLPRLLLDQLSARGLTVSDPAEPGVNRPTGPFTAVPVRRQGDVVAVVLSLPHDDESSALLEDAVASGFPGSTSDLPTVVGSLDEVAAQMSIPLDAVVVLRDGRPVGFLAVAVDRRSSGASAPTAAGPAPAGSSAMGSSVRSAAAPAGGTVGAPVDGALGLLRNVALEVTVELGRASLTLAQLLGLTIGSVVELDRAAGSPVDTRVNGMLFGRGEVVVVGDEYAVRVTEILSNGLPG